MARNFNGSSQYGRNAGGALVTAFPCTLHCWFKPAGNPASSGQFSLVTLARPTATDVFLLSYNNDATLGLIVRSATVSAAGFRINYKVQTLTAGTWYALTAVFTDSATQLVYFNGTAGGTNSSTANATPTSIVDLFVGARILSNTAQHWTNGDIAEVAVWDAALTAAEVGVLADGFSPMLVRPGNLAHYAPLIGRASPELEVVGGKSLTLTGSPAAATHPRIFLPKRSRMFDLAAAGAYEDAASDAATLADSGTQVGVFPAAASDAATAADSAASLATVASTATDAAGAGDSATQLAVLPSSATDAVAAADSGEAALALAGAASDAVAPADSADQLAVLVAGGADAAAAADSADLLAVLPAEATDAAAPADAADQLGVFDAAGSDAATPGDTAAQLAVVDAGATDAAPAGDSAAQLLVASSEAADAAGLGDAGESLQISPAAALDAATASDQAEALVSSEESAADAVAASDSAAAATAIALVATDAAVPADEAAADSALGAVASDAAAPADAAVLLLVGELDAADAAAPGDSADALSAVDAVAPDAVLAEDAAGATLRFDLDAAESWTVGDLALGIGGSTPTPPSIEADLIALLRARLGVPVFLNAADEGVQAPYVVLASQHEPTLGLYRPLPAAPLDSAAGATDALSVGDGGAVGGAFAALAADGAAPADAAGESFAPFGTASDAAAPGDTAAVSGAFAAAASDAATLSATGAAQRTGAAAASQGVSLGDSATSAAPSVETHLLYTDTPSVPVGGFLSVYGIFDPAAAVTIGGVACTVVERAAAATSGKFAELSMIRVVVPSMTSGSKAVAVDDSPEAHSVFVNASGRVLYVSLTGNDGTAAVNNPALPWRYLQNQGAGTGAYFACAAGDQIVIRGGSWSDTNGWDTTWMRAAQSGNARNGTATAFIHVTSYPGEDVHYTTPADKSGGIAGPWSGIAGTSGEYWAVSNLRMEIAGGANSDAAPINFQYTEGPWWVVNNELGPWVEGDSTQLKAAGVSGHGAGMRILGNHIHDIEGTAALENHGIYADSTAEDWEIGWNWIHDVSGGSLVQFNDNEGIAGGSWPGFVGMQVHHNWLENAAKYGINYNDVGAEAGEFSGEHWANVIVGTALPPIRINSTQPDQALVFHDNVVFNAMTTNSGSGNGYVRSEGWGSGGGGTIANEFSDNVFAVGDDTVSGTSWFEDAGSPAATSTTYAFAGNTYYGNGSGIAQLTWDATRVVHAGAMPAGLLVVPIP